MDDLLVERVLRAVECTPPGRVVTYGDIAAVLGCSPRQVGAVMARWGGAVAWWRVVNARGVLPDPLGVRARPHWIDEGVPTRADGGVRLGECRWELGELARSWGRATADLPERESGPAGDDRGGSGRSGG